MRHGLWLAAITRLWLLGLNIDWDCLVLHCIMDSCDQWEFPPFDRPQWQSLCTALTAGVPAARAVQGDCERVTNPSNTVSRLARASLEGFIVVNQLEIVVAGVYVNSSSPGQNGSHFAEDIFRCIFMNEKFCILIKISLKFVSKGPIDNNPALV